MGGTTELTIRLPLPLKALLVLVCPPLHQHQPQHTLLTAISGPWTDCSPGKRHLSLVSPTRLSSSAPMSLFTMMPPFLAASTKRAPTSAGPLFCFIFLYSTCHCPQEQRFPLLLTVLAQAELVKPSRPLSRAPALLCCSPLSASLNLMVLRRDSRGLETTSSRSPELQKPRVLPRFLSTNFSSWFSWISCTSRRSSSFSWASRWISCRRPS